MNVSAEARVAPESVDLDARQLARVDEHLLRRYVNPGRLAGTLLLVARGGQVAHLSCLGSMDLARDKAMAEDAIFRIYSMTKPITSVAVMMLYERGLVSLDHPIERYLPALAQPRVFVRGRYPDMETAPAPRSITIHDLLTHTAGLTYHFQSRTNVDAAYRRTGVITEDADSDLAEFIERLGRMPLDFAPGEAWTYSVATDVLGRLVEVVSGQTLDAFFADNILGPLGMVDTHFRIPSEKLERFSSCYFRKPDRSLGIQDDAGRSRYARERMLLSGGGGLLSTAADYVRFCEMLRRGGRLGDARILGRKTIELMTKNHLPGGVDLASLARGSFSEARNQGVGFGLGFSVSLDPARARISGTPGEFAWGGMASTAFWIDPVEDLTVVFMTQLVPSNTYSLRADLKALIYAALD